MILCRICGAEATLLLMCKSCYSRDVYILEQRALGIDLGPTQHEQYKGASIRKSKEAVHLELKELKKEGKALRKNLRQQLKKEEKELRQMWCAMFKADIDAAALIHSLLPDKEAAIAAAKEAKLQAYTIISERTTTVYNKHHADIQALDLFLKTRETQIKEALK